MKRSVLAISVALACCPEPSRPDTSHVPADCSVACDSLAHLGCPEALPNASGLTCEEVCRKAGPMLDVACVAASSSIEQVRTCHVRCQK